MIGLFESWITRLLLFDFGSIVRFLLTLTLALHDKHYVGCWKHEILEIADEEFTFETMQLLIYSIKS